MATPNVRKRVFQYGWCERTEIDYVCTHCETIVLDGVHCQWCKATPAIPGEKKINPGLAVMQEGNRIARETRIQPPKADRPKGGVNPGILAMREKNRLRKEAKNATISL